MFTASVPGARSLTLGAKGTVFVGTRAGSVYAVRDDNGDGAADRVLTIELRNLANEKLYSVDLEPGR